MAAIQKAIIESAERESRGDHKDKDKDRKKGNFKIKAFWESLLKELDIPCATAKDLSECGRAENQSRRKRLVFERFLQNPYWQSEIAFEDLIDIFVLQMNSKT